MTTHLALVGEQPMPVLLPDLFLRPARTLLVCTARSRPVAQRLLRLLPHAVIEETDPYELPAILARLVELAPADQPALVNLTGGTKMMMLGAFALTMQRGWDFVYLESERLPALLYRYTFASGALRRKEKTTLPTLITAADYLRAHLPGFRSEGFSRDEHGKLTDGGLFEQAVHAALHPYMDEVLVGVRPEGVGDQIEIDLVLRQANQVAIAEVKLGRGEEGPKKGIDQLSTAGSREYLGTYTRKFLITAGYMSERVRQLAAEKQVTLIQVSGYRSGRLIPYTEAGRLVADVQKALA